MSQNWEGITEFVHTVDKGSFSEAALELGVSRSHVSKKVKMLETRLGVELLHRTTRSLNLTSLGAEFYPKCKHLLGEMDEAQALLSDEAAKPQGTIRLTVAGAFGERILAPALADFASVFPDISIDAYFTNRVVNLSEERFDLALRSGLGEEICRNNENAELLYEYELLTVASPDYLAKTAPISTISELQDHNCLAGSLPHWRFMQGGQVQNMSVHGMWRSNNGHALVEAAKKGLGIIQVPDFYVEQAVGEGALTPVLPRNAVAGLGYYAVVPADHMPRRVAMLIGHLKEKFQRL